MKEKVLLKKECGEILFLQNETAVMVIKTEISHDGSAVFLNECISILQKLLQEPAEHQNRIRGFLCYSREYGWMRDVGVYGRMTMRSQLPEENMKSCICYFGIKAVY